MYKTSAHRVNNFCRVSILCCALFAVLLAMGHHAVRADAGQTDLYTLRQSVVAAGGRTTGGVYTLTAIVGQPATGSQSGGVYTLGSGMLGGGVSSSGVPTAVQTRTQTQLIGWSRLPFVAMIGLILVSYGVWKGRRRDSA